MLTRWSNDLSITSKTRLKITVIEDEEDILTLYKDFLITRGHEVFASSNGDNVMANFFKNRPDIAVMDYRMVGHKSGIDAAIEILSEYPLFPILFITGYEQLFKDIINYTIFRGKKIAILIKPVFLMQMEDSILKLL